MAAEGNPGPRTARSSNVSHSTGCGIGRDTGPVGKSTGTQVLTITHNPRRLPRLTTRVLFVPIVSWLPCMRGSERDGACTASRVLSEVIRAGTSAAREESHADAAEVRRAFQSVG